MSDVHCVICDEASRDGGVIRLNDKGEAGVWACFKHRPLFERELRPTTEVLERAMEIKAKTFS
jgi:hypothetical protein